MAGFCHRGPRSTTSQQKIPSGNAESAKTLSQIHESFRKGLHIPEVKALETLSFAIVSVN